MHMIVGALWIEVQYSANVPRVDPAKALTGEVHSVMHDGVVWIARF